MGTAARNTAIHVNGTNLSGYFSQEDSTWTGGLEDTTAYGSAVTAKTWTPTLSEGTLTLAGFWDDTAGGILDVLNAAYASATQAICSIWHTGDSVGNRGVAIKGDVKTTKDSAQVDGVLKISTEVTSSVGEEDVISLHALTQETADGNGTTVDNTAATTAGGSAYLHVSEMTTALTVHIYHSTDNFATDDTLLATFAADPTANTAERITISGTIRQYTRVEWTQTGNATFGVGLHRN